MADMIDRSSMIVNMLVVNSSMEIHSSSSYNIKGREMAGVCPGRAKGQG